MLYSKEAEAQVAMAKTPKQKKQMALDAISYALRRVQQDPDFRWHMAGTETAARLLRAYAALSGRTLKSVNDAHESAIVVDAKPRYRHVGHDEAPEPEPAREVKPTKNDEADLNTALLAIIEDRHGRREREEIELALKCATY